MFPFVKNCFTLDNITLDFGSRPEHRSVTDLLESMARILVIPLAMLAVIVSVSVYYWFAIPYDPRQPPRIRSNTPFLGHMIGLLRYGAGYYSKIAEECNLPPIFTLEIGRSRTYVVTSPHLAAVCDRRSRVVSFVPCAINFAQRILRASRRTMRLLSEDLAEEKGPVAAVGLRVENMRAIHQSLVPGEHLDEISRTMLTHLANVFEAEFGGGGEEDKRIPLFRWIRNFVTIASTDTLYGPEKNPMRDAEVMNGFWEVDRGFAMLGLAVFPDILARKASRGRKRFVQGFLEYYAAGDGLATASRLIQARYEVNRRYRVPHEDIARFDLGVCTGLLVNTIPAIFWAVLRVFSDPDLLRELRQSLDDEMIAADLPKSSPTTTTISISGAIKRCPLVESLVSEVLRIHSTNASARVLLEDMAITDPSGGGTTYLLKKDSFLTVPSALFHKNQALWGAERGRVRSGSLWQRQQPPKSPPFRQPDLRERGARSAPAAISP
ncbi:hypothetical protein PG988_006045 [Apiospora saccharicola]